MVLANVVVLSEPSVDRRSRPEVLWRAIGIEYLTSQRPVEALVVTVFQRPYRKDYGDANSW